MSLATKKSKPQTKTKIRQPSNELRGLISNAVKFGLKFKTAILDALEQGKKEGFSPLEIGNMIRAEAKGEFSDRQIRRLLPPEAKHSEKVRAVSKPLVKPTLHLVRSESDKPEQFADKISAKLAAMEQPVIPVQPTPESIQEEEESKPDPVIQALEPESRPEPDPQIVLDDVVEYNLADLEKYDKPLLIKIVKMQYEQITKLFDEYIPKYDALRDEAEAMTDQASEQRTKKAKSKSK